MNRKEEMEVSDEMLVAAMRAFEPMSSVLRYREKDKWHTCDMMAMRDAIRAVLALRASAAPEEGMVWRCVHLHDASKEVQWTDLRPIAEARVKSGDWQVIPIAALPSDSGLAAPVAWRDALKAARPIIRELSTTRDPEYRDVLAKIDAALAPATEDGGYVAALEHIAEIIREETRTTSDGTIHNSTDVAKAILTRIPALSPSPSVGTWTVAGQHLAWLFQYMQCMNERNWRDMRDNAIRQLEQLSLMFPGRAGVAQPSARRDTP